MAITYTFDSKGQADGVGAAITSNTLTCATGDFITIIGIYADNSDSTAWTVSNTGTAITWTLQAQTNTFGNSRVVLWTGTAGATPPTTVTVTSTAGNLTNGSKYIATICHTGAHATTPLPAGNIFTGVSATDVSQSITPTSSGSALWMGCGDWSATNTYAAGTNCTLVGGYNEASFMTTTVVRPTTQPRTDGAAFTLAETDTAGTIAYIAFEVQAAASGDTALTGQAETESTGKLGVSIGDRKLSIARQKFTPRRNRKSSSGFELLTPFSLVAKELWPLGFASGGGVNVALTGQTETESQGNLGVSHNRALTGQNETESQGNVTASQSLALSGQNETDSAGNITGSLNNPLSGQAETESQGNLTANQNTALTGQLETESQGTVTPTTDTIVALTGQEETESQGSLTPAISIALTGLAETESTGTITPSTDILVALTGQSETESQGTLNPVLAALLSGLVETDNQGSVSPAIDTPLTGLLETESQGTVTPQTGDINIALTGIQETESQGILTPFTPIAQVVIGGHYSPPKPKNRREELRKQIERIVDEYETINNISLPIVEKREIIKQADNKLLTSNKQIVNYNETINDLLVNIEMQILFLVEKQKEEQEDDDDLLLLS